MKKLLLGLAVLGMWVMGAGAQEGHVTKAATAKLQKLPVLPQCMEFAAQEGDPFKGPSVLFIKMTAGCKVPWHWHTANERLYIVSGRAKAEMKDHPAEAVAAGDFVYLPGKMHHQFTCATACTFFDAPDGTFDIHYVKADGTEIQPEEALKAGEKKAPMKKEAPKG